MSTTKRILAAMLSVMLVLCTVTVSFAEETIGVSLSASNTAAKNTVSCDEDGTFNLYFATDKLELNSKKLNTYKFTVWYDAKSLKLEDGKIANALAVQGQPVHEYTKKTVDNIVYTGYTFTFTSFEKGFGAGKAFNALAKIPFKALKTGTTTVSVALEDVLLLPVAEAPNFNEALAASVSNASVKVTVNSSDDSSGSSFFGGGSNSMAVKRTVIFNVDGATTSVVIADGKKVTKPQDPVKEGYTFDGWYEDKKFEVPYDFNVEVTESIVLYAKFVKNADVPEVKLPFTDVKADDWFYQGVEYVWSKNMVKGVTDTTYSPNGTLTRATLVTLLYRMENEPSAPANGFTDVAGGAWYENAVAWAADNAIVLGVGEGLFAPDANITREQIAVILYKYATLKGKDVSKTADLNAFSDAASVSDWAKDALSWAVAEGLLQGMGDGTVAPKANATRAQIATILMRYMQ
ncbi:MAG: S-layer homology domain-containing protein [Clostridia bacterium]|nr:S-layer homology domain-containing protein [Clostridia bacterium]